MKRLTTSHKLCFTRNAHAHLCLATVRRLFARAWYASAGEARVARVAFAVRVEAVCCTWVVWCRSCLVFVPVVSKPQWPRRAVVLDLHLHRQRTLSSVIDYIYVSRAYLNVLDYGVTTFRVTFLSVTQHVHTYFVRIDPRFRVSR